MVEETLTVNQHELEQTGQCFIYSNQINQRPTAQMLKTYQRHLLKTIQEREGVLQQCSLVEVADTDTRVGYIVVALAELPAYHAFLVEDAFQLEVPILNLS